jgi:hypothetical protein
MVEQVEPQDEPIEGAEDLPDDVRDGDVAAVEDAPLLPSENDDDTPEKLP